jgi:hypothetical protein
MRHYCVSIYALCSPSRVATLVDIQSKQEVLCIHYLHGMVIKMDVIVSTTITTIIPLQLTCCIVTVTSQEAAVIVFKVAEVVALLLFRIAVAVAVAWLLSVRKHTAVSPMCAVHIACIRISSCAVKQRLFVYEQPEHTLPLQYST